MPLLFQPNLRAALLGHSTQETLTGPKDLCFRRIFLWVEVEAVAVALRELVLPQCLATAVVAEGLVFREEAVVAVAQQWVRLVAALAEWVGMACVWW